MSNLVTQHVTEVSQELHEKHGSHLTSSWAPATFDNRYKRVLNSNPVTHGDACTVYSVQVMYMNTHETKVSSNR